MHETSEGQSHALAFHLDRLERFDTNEITGLSLLTLALAIVICGFWKNRKTRL